ncbi:methionyl-tRNA formyltransferase [gamma proteobacterium HTCC5015]|nr:methionyl-tRNA formyltransferase [gamma proteobacterium HTCC5015]
MSPQRIVYAGTPDFAVPALEQLIAARDEHNIDIVGVYTQPDRPAGRGRQLKPSPVKQCALDHQLPVFQPEHFKDSNAQRQLTELAPDLMVVAAYGLLLPLSVLQTPRMGCVNLHASLLPRWRGAAPIQRAIEAGDSETGITLMQMAEGLDTGDMLAKATVPIDETTTGGRLHDQLAELGGQLLKTHLSELLSGQLNGEAQEDALSNYARKLDKAEANIVWSDSALAIARRIRAFNPWPVASTRYSDGALRLWLATAADNGAATTPGTVLQCNKHGIVVSCGEDGSQRLNISQLQRPGGKPMDASAFANAVDLSGQVLGS